MLTNPAVIITLQYVSVPNHHTAYLTLTQTLYVNYVSIKLGGGNDVYQKVVPILPHSVNK